MASQMSTGTEGFWLLQCFNLICFFFATVVISVIIKWKKFEASLVVHLEHKLDYIMEHSWTANDVRIKEDMEEFEEENFVEELVEEGKEEELIGEEESEVHLEEGTRIDLILEREEEEHMEERKKVIHEECMTEYPPRQEEAVMIEAEEKPLKPSCFRNALRAIFRRRKGKKHAGPMVIVY